MTISIVIPIVDELSFLKALIAEIRNNAGDYNTLEILVVDGCENRETEDFCAGNNLVYVLSRIKQRAHQMNLGADLAKGDILYFLHCDSIPPAGFDLKISETLRKSMAGCFRLKFEPNNAILSFYSFFSRFGPTIFHGGDASLFISKSDFVSLGKFDERKTIMEDYDIIQRIKRKGKFMVLIDSVITSSRKYKVNGYFLLQWRFTVIHLMNAFGFGQKRLLAYYKKNIRS